MTLQENIIPVCLHTEEDSLGTSSWSQYHHLSPLLQSGPGAGSLAGASRAKVFSVLCLCDDKHCPGGSLAPVLRQLEVPILSNKRCELLYRRAGHPQYIPDIFMCAGYSQVFLAMSSRHLNSLILIREVETRVTGTRAGRWECSWPGVRTSPGTWPGWSAGASGVGSGTSPG